MIQFASLLDCVNSSNCYMNSLSLLNIENLKQGTFKQPEKEVFWLYEGDRFASTMIISFLLTDVI